MTWYNKYRPLSFDDVVGQELVKQVLKNSLTQNRIKHSYLLTGPKGTGKTTMARIFANLLNETIVNPQATLDIIEMDAASNTGIDDIRFLTEVAQVPPIAGKYKIYIIDEVHMLSKSAMNALLKILEEPPKYLIFLLATTNPEKLLPTVMSRLTKLTLNSHSIQGLVDRMRYIADIEGITITDKALEVIASRSSGGQRDAINHLETVASFGLGSYDITNVSELLGLVNQVLIQEVIDGLISQNLNTDLTKQVSSLGLDGQLFLGQVFEHILNLSLDGNSDYDDLINPIAEVVSYQLPSLTPLTALAILQSKLGIRVFQKSSTSTANPTVKSLKKKTESKNLVNTEITNESNKFGIVNKIEEEVQVQVEAEETLVKDSISSELTVTLAQKFFQKLNQLANTPPTLKMCLQDVQVVSIEDKIVSFTTSNGFFLNLINNPINQKFLRSEFESNYGVGYVLSVSIRNNNLADLVTQSISVQPEKSIKLPTKSMSVEAEIYTNSSDGIFYEAYKSLKPGMEDKGIKIHAPLQSNKTDIIPTVDVESQEMFDDLISDLDLE